MFNPFNRTIEKALTAGRFKPCGKKQLTLWFFFDFEHDFTPWVSAKELANQRALISAAVRADKSIAAGSHTGLAKWYATEYRLSEWAWEQKAY